MRRDCHNKPSKPYLIPDINIPIIFKNCIIRQQTGIDFHGCVIDQVGNYHLKLNTKQIGLKKESYDNCCNDVNDDEIFHYVD